MHQFIIPSFQYSNQQYLRVFFSSLPGYMNDCRAAVVTAHNQPLEIQRVPVPDPLEPGALLVKITASTLCGTDVHRWRPAAGRRHCRSLPDMSPAVSSKRSMASAPTFWESR